MTLTNLNQLAVSSLKDINIYSFDVDEKSFSIIKTIKGHTRGINAIKLMKSSIDLLISCSHDMVDCRLWSISQENCLKIFRGHSDWIPAIQKLSEKCF